jgi:hypothetical protein
MKLSRRTVINHVNILNDFEASTTYKGPQVLREKITSIKSNTLDIIEDNKSWQERVKTEFDRLNDHTEESIKEFDAAQTAAYNQAISLYFMRHKTYQEWLNKEVEIEVDTIYLDDVKGSPFYSNNYLFDMNKVFFAVKPTLPKVKEAASDKAEKPAK